MDMSSQVLSCIPVQLTRDIIIHFWRMRRRNSSMHSMISEISSFDLRKLEQDYFGGTKMYADYSQSHTIGCRNCGHVKIAYMFDLQSQYSSEIFAHWLDFQATSVLLRAIHSKILSESAQHRLACHVLAKGHLHLFLWEHSTHCGSSRTSFCLGWKTLRFLLKVFHPVFVLVDANEAMVCGSRNCPILLQTNDQSNHVTGVPALRAISSRWTRRNHKFNPSRTEVEL